MAQARPVRQNIDSTTDLTSRLLLQFATALDVSDNSPLSTGNSANQKAERDELLSLMGDVFDVMRYNNTTLLNPLLQSLQHDSRPEDLAEHLRRNLEALPDRDYRNLDEDRLHALALRLSRARPDTEGISYEELEEDEGNAWSDPELKFSFVDYSTEEAVLEPRRAPSATNARCEAHTSVEEWIPCPDCESLFSVCTNLAIPVAVPRSQTTLEDEHIMIVGITQGWDEASKSDCFDETWKAWALFDANLSTISKPIERLASYIVRYWQSYITRPPEQRDLSQLPLHYRPTPSQLEGDHDELIDVCPYPTIREGLIRHRHKYPGDTFWQPYVDAYRFLWPLDVNDTFVLDPVTGRYSFSVRFRQCMLEPRCWALTSDFFEIFPEFRGDTMKFEPQLATYRNRGMIVGPFVPLVHPQVAHARDMLVRSSSRPANKRQRSQKSTSDTSESHVLSKTTGLTSSVQAVQLHSWSVQSIRNSRSMKSSEEMLEPLSDDRASDCIGEDPIAVKTTTHTFSTRLMRFP